MHLQRNRSSVLNQHCQFLVKQDAINMAKTMAEMALKKKCLNELVTAVRTGDKGAEGDKPSN